MKLLVVGGCGYIGSVLVPKLLAKGHSVHVVDTEWFGNHLEPHVNLGVSRCDMRDLFLPAISYDACICLAAIANDPCAEYDARATMMVNIWGTMRLAEQCYRGNVPRFLFASSASVYGIKDNAPVTEEADLAPVSDYNVAKACGERILMSYRDKLLVQIVRPATVCGPSPRMRFDTIVNKFCADAFTKGEITVHVGENSDLMRPNIHIEDMCDLYCWLLDHPEARGTFNAGFENISIRTIAEMVAAETSCKVNYLPVRDKRSYAVDSSKLLRKGFSPQWTVKDAINQVLAGLMTGSLKVDETTTNLTWMQKNGWIRG